MRVFLILPSIQVLYKGIQKISHKYDINHEIMGKVMGV